MTPSSYEQFRDTWSERAQLAWDVLEMKPTRGIPSWLVHLMDMPYMEEVTGHKPGDYAKDPDEVYLAYEKLAGVCFIDQYLATNPLTMGQCGFESDAARTATAGAEEIVLDGLAIDSPEAVIEHMEKYVFPQRAEKIKTFDPNDPEHIGWLIESQCKIQKRFGGDILKGPYGKFQSFPYLEYQKYGYENYFLAYVSYPEVMEKDFTQQADLAVLENQAAVNAIVAGGLPRMIRLDYDMADSRSMLVDIKSLDKIWFPHFARSIKPFLEADIRLIWHCDGNLMEMVPRLLEVGLRGFQGFQYEDGMDYERICRMTDRDGGPLLIIAGSSVTRALPFGTKDDVVKELKWLVENGPPVGLMLGANSSIVPGTKHENIKALMAGLNYYREHGRDA